MKHRDSFSPPVQERSLARPALFLQRCTTWPVTELIGSEGAHILSIIAQHPIKVGIICLDFIFVEEKENVALLKSGRALFDGSVDVLGCILAI